VAAEMAATAGGPCEENELLKSVQEIAVKLIQRLQGGEAQPPPMKETAIQGNIPPPPKEEPPAETGNAPEPAPAGETVHAHDGWFLRLAAGGGFARSAVKGGDVNNENVTMGGGVAWSGSAGYTLAPNVVVHLDSFGITLVEPPAYVDGVKEQTNGTYSLAAVGAGMTYYFMPSNLFVSAAAGLGVLRAKFARVATLETEAGFAANVLFGKEWWMSDDWAIGVTAQAMYSAVPSRWETTQNTIAGAILFCATFN
jgi:hypothetical protein